MQIHKVTKPLSSGFFCIISSIIITAIEINEYAKSKKIHPICRCKKIKMRYIKIYYFAVCEQFIKLLFVMFFKRFFEKVYT